MDTPNSRAVKDYEAALSAVERGEPGSDTLLSRCTATMDAAGGWELASTAKEILNTLGIVNPNLRVADLSGGQRRRVALAAAMLSNPDLMLLDEPTNHMDVDVIKWMSGWLNSSPMAVLFVTHDRHFMEVASITSIKPHLHLIPMLFQTTFLLWCRL